MPLPRMQRSAWVSFTEEAVTHADALQFRVADVREQALAPAQDLHEEIDSTAGGAAARSGDGLVQFALLVG